MLFSCGYAMQAPGLVDLKRRRRVASRVLLSGTRRSDTARTRSSERPLSLEQGQDNLPQSRYRVNGRAHHSYMYWVYTLPYTTGRSIPIPVPVKDTAHPNVRRLAAAAVPYDVPPRQLPGWSVRHAHGLLLRHPMPFTWPLIYA